MLIIQTESIFCRPLIGQDLLMDIPRVFCLFLSERNYCIQRYLIEIYSVVPGRVIHLFTNHVEEDVIRSDQLLKLYLQEIWLNKH